MDIKTTDPSLPLEIHSSFRDTFEAITKSELKNKENKIKMTIHGYSDDPEIINSITLTKED